MSSNISDDVPALPLSCEPTPLVVVEGFLSSTGSIGYAPVRNRLHGFRKHLGDRRLLVASVGPVSSLHDRACELYYCIMGGIVDYGQNHAQIHSHGQYGRTHPIGLYPEWSTSHPLHFLGHSMGGPTIVKLQALLAQKHFHQDDHPDMILSISTVSAPFRGTQLVYSLGESTESAPAVRPWSIGAVLSRAVHVLSYLSPSLPKVLDLHADARLLSYTSASFISFLKQLWESDWAESKDATPYDVTFEAADDREALGEGKCNPGTYYRSYAAYMTEPSSTSSRDKTHTPPLRHLYLQPLYFFAWTIGSFDFQVLKTRPSFLGSGEPRDVECGARTHDPLGEEYWANDGVVPLFSQWHPYDCGSTQCSHATNLSHYPTKIPPSNAIEPINGSTLSPGVWHVHTLPDTHHLSIISIWLGTAKQQAFWTDIHAFFTDIDTQQCRTQSRNRNDHNARIGHNCTSRL